MPLPAPTRPIETALIDPGEPWQNATDDSFNGRFRDKYLTLQWFRTRVDAKIGIEQWRHQFKNIIRRGSARVLDPAPEPTKAAASGSTETC